MSIQVDETLNAEGLSCPMPVIRTKKTIEAMQEGQVLEVRATDRGSIADLQGWARRTGHQYIGLREEEGVIRHFIRKASAREVREEIRYPHIIHNDEVRQMLESGRPIQIIDVREPAEFTFGRIPGALSIPLGELEHRAAALDPDQEYVLVCRTGHRSDLAAHILSEKGFRNLKNMLPGMSQWDGPIQRD